VPLLVMPAMPPVAVTPTTMTLADASEYGVVLVPRLELAAPPLPAVAVVEPPPAPPIANWFNCSSPVVLPDTALVIVVAAPAPPFAPKSPLPPAPPVRVTAALAETAG
jgi:hypothetical protein